MLVASSHLPCLSLSRACVCVVGWSQREERFLGLHFFSPVGKVETMEKGWARGKSKAISSRVAGLGRVRRPLWTVILVRRVCSHLLGEQSGKSGRCWPGLVVVLVSYCVGNRFCCRFNTCESYDALSLSLCCSHDRHTVPS